MKHNLQKKELILQFLKFGIVGVGNTIISMATYYIVLWINQDMYMVGSIFGAILSIFHAFCWNNFYVFAKRNQTVKQFFVSLGKCYISYSGTSILNNIMLWVEVSFWGLGKKIAPIINLLITIPLNFLINKFWTFKTGEDEE